jgi:hypothetical protein
MMRLRRTTLLVAFALLTSAGTAYAECAWVLWFDVPSRGTITPLNAFSSKADCDQQRSWHDKHAEERIARWQQRQAEGKVEKLPESGILTCFPDTIDPRAPKGK